MKIKLSFYFLIPILASAQQFGGSSIGDFVGQLTNLINQSGGLGNLASGLQRPQGFPVGGDGNDGFGIHQGPSGSPILTGPSNFGQGHPYPPSAYDHQYHHNPYQTPQHQGFLSALSSIVRYDDLKCVPRLLCEVTSGGKPGYIGSSQSLVPSTNKDTLIALLTVLNFIDESPLFVFGRAALLGYTARGNSRACLTAYPTCPSDPDTLVDYLNNHNGGFFRFFGGLQQPQPGYPPHIPPNYPPHQYGYYGSYGDDRYPRPYKKHGYPYRPHDQGPTYQDGAYREDDPYSAYNYAGAANYYEGRIQNHRYPVVSIQGQSSPVIYQQPYNDIHQTKNEKLVFPNNRGGKSLVFPDERPSNYNNAEFFPDRTGTGNLILGQQGVHYYSGPPNLVNFRDQRSVKFPSSMEFPLQ